MFPIRAEGRGVWNESFAALERGISYPLGDDRFEIDHGDDYFAFFDRLGETTTWAAADGDRLVGTFSLILRQVPDAEGRRRPVFYGCDLKVQRQARGRGIAGRLLVYAYLRSLLTCRIGYTISMNPAGKSTNPIIDTMLRFPLRRGAMAAGLELFSLNCAEMEAFAPVLELHRGPLSYLSLAGRKDIVLQSTGAPMPLLHLQFGPFAETGRMRPVPGHVHMFCTPTRDPLSEAARAHGLEPSATATVAQAGMTGQTWNFILTSDI